MRITGRLHGNRDLLIQVFLNLLKNAAEAVPPTGGEIAIATAYQQGVRLAVPGADSLVLTALNTPGPGLFFQATGLAASAVPFGDGQLCASVNIVRMGVVFPSGGSAAYPGGLTPAPIGSFGATAGTPLHYQCWYRDAVAFCTPSTFNTSNGYRITW